MLKLALVQIAQGKRNEALALLEAARGALDASDHGLALALAGQPNEAITMLEPAARQPGADSRVRQNLALAYALAGDWTAARTVASQDVPADQLDVRIEQWMVLANPTKASDQVAALIGVSPAAADPGQPVRLALKGTDERMAALVPTLPATIESAPDPAPVVAAVEAPEAAPQPVEAMAVAPRPKAAAPNRLYAGTAPAAPAVPRPHRTAPSLVHRGRTAGPQRKSHTPGRRSPARRCRLRNDQRRRQLAAYD